MQNVVYTCVTGCHDRIQQPRVRDEAWNYIVFTDAVSEPEIDGIWQLLPLPKTALDAVVVDTQETEQRHVRLARYMKLQGWKHLECDVSIWIDASFTLLEKPSHFAESFIATGHDIMLFKHPRWSCVAQEFEFCRQTFHVEEQVLRKQEERYIDEGLSLRENAAVATGILMRKHQRNAALEATMDMWWQELCAGSSRDQCSVAFALWRNQSLAWSFHEKVMDETHSVSFAKRDVSTRKAGRLANLYTFRQRITGATFNDADVTEAIRHMCGARSMTISPTQNIFASLELHPTQQTEGRLEVRHNDTIERIDVDANGFVLESREIDLTGQSFAVAVKESLQGVKCGVIITTHGTGNGGTISRCLVSVLRHTPHPRKIWVFDNESADDETLALKSMFPEVHYVRIDDQTAFGGLTGTWNAGCTDALSGSSPCDVVVLLNHDTVVNQTWTHLLASAAAAQKSKDPNRMGPYGPTSDNSGSSPLPEQVRDNMFHARDRNEAHVKMGFSELAKGHKDLSTGPNGFCLAFPADVLRMNNFDEQRKFFFDPDRPFGSNENEWLNRWRVNHGARVFFVRSALVLHEKHSAWRALKNVKTKDVPFDHAEGVVFTCALSEDTKPQAACKTDQSSQGNRWSFVCLTAHGVELDPALGWTPFALPPKATKGLEMEYAKSIGFSLFGKRSTIWVDPSLKMIVDPSKLDSLMLPFGHNVGVFAFERDADPVFTGVIARRASSDVSLSSELWWTMLSKAKCGASEGALFAMCFEAKPFPDTILFRARSSTQNERPFSACFL